MDGAPASGPCNQAGTKNRRESALRRFSTVLFQWVLLYAKLPIQEGYNLTSGAIGIRAERGNCGSLGNRFFNNPLNYVCIVRAGGHIFKRIGGCHRWGTCRAILEGDDLRPGGNAIGVKCRSAGAAGDSFLRRPQNSLKVIASAAQPARAPMSKANYLSRSLISLTNQDL